MDFLPEPNEVLGRLEADEATPDDRDLFGASGNLLYRNRIFDVPKVMDGPTAMKILCSMMLLIVMEL